MIFIIGGYNIKLLSIMAYVLLSEFILNTKTISLEICVIYRITLEVVVL